MNKRINLAMSGLMLIIGASVSNADSDSVHIVTRYSHKARIKTSHAVNRDATRMAWAVTNDQQGIVSRDLHNQPVNAHLAEVRVDHQTIYIDPEVDYIRKDRVVRMSPNYLTAALNEHRYQAAKNRRIVTRDYGRSSGMQQDEMGRIVIFRPGFGQDRLGTEPGKKMIPSVPGKPDKTTDELMVSNKVLSPDS